MEAPASPSAIFVLLIVIYDDNNVMEAPASPSAILFVVYHL
jgi:hypothetical protein